MTKLLQLIKVLLITLCVLLVSCDEPQVKQPPIHRFKWDVAVCNDNGCNHYDADTFVRDGDVYKLYTSDTLTNVIQILPGVPIIISKQ
jgi:hypothetical protein